MKESKNEKIFKLLYRKWVKGECRHICSICEYIDYCKGYREIEEQE